jgi:signal transduction histidine kinase/CheY-like chemotaxis protein
MARVSEGTTFELALNAPARRDLQALVFPVAGADGAVADSGVLFHDVTHERDLVRTKDELLSVVSHELRTPLASLVGFAELLLKRDYAEAQRREYLTVMYEEGRRLTALITDFLDLQRMESGRQTVHLRPMPLQPVLLRAIAAAGEDVQRPIVLDVPSDLPDVDGDGDRLQQVLANLFSNARKYSPAGGEIVVSARLDEGSLIVRVQDHGLGLPPDAIPQMFQKFYRVDNSDRRTIAGTGLGLAICRQIIAEHGGNIGVESAGLGQGTCFWLTLSLAKPNLASGDVLIVEDDVGFARLMEAELANYGLSAVRAADADAAVELLAAGQPKAILLDLVLPRTSGEELLARMAANGGVEAPVVVATVKDLSVDERRHLQALGAVAILAKGPDAAQRAARAVAGACLARRQTDHELWRRVTSGALEEVR